MNKKKNIYSVFCYDAFGHCDKYDYFDFDFALNRAIDLFKNVNYQIVRMVSPYQDNDVLYMSKVGY